jgi:cell pole-organizing protein PopZ
MSEPNVQEPTMEEILASIRRIISEDEPHAEAAPAEAAAPEPIPAAKAEPEPEPVAVATADEVLELTDPLPDPEPEPVVAETHGDLEVRKVAPEPAPEPDVEPLVATAIDDEPLVGGVAADQTASAFGHLARSIAMPKQGRSLEDVVRELLNPLLKAWLDENLPAIVQAKVEEEVERIARRRMR